ncbi:hypothetical protein [Actinomadura violacea]|nr:hypothetical protein [Actinomadura violacea]
MSTMTQVLESPAAEDAVMVEIVEDVNETADDAISLGCGNDNPYT